MRDRSVFPIRSRSEEHTSELQSLTNLVCRLLLEKKNASYLKQNMLFFVARVNLAEKAKLGLTYLRPLQTACESPKLILPIRLGTGNADGQHARCSTTQSHSARAAGLLCLHVAAHRPRRVHELPARSPPVRPLDPRLRGGRLPRVLQSPLHLSFSKQADAHRLPPFPLTHPLPL